MPDKPPFVIQPYRSIDKWIEVTGPDQLSLRVDYDDVNQKTVRKALEKMVGILNQIWNENPDQAFWERANAFHQGMEAGEIVKNFPKK